MYLAVLSHPLICGSESNGINTVTHGAPGNVSVRAPRTGRLYLNMNWPPIQIHCSLACSSAGRSRSFLEVELCSHRSHSTTTTANGHCSRSSRRAAKSGRRHTLLVMIIKVGAALPPLLPAIRTGNHCTLCCRRSLTLASRCRGWSRWICRSAGRRGSVLTVAWLLFFLAGVAASSSRFFQDPERSSSPELQGARSDFSRVGRSTASSIGSPRRIGGPGAAGSLSSLDSNGSAPR
jgi:hypothetical protein